VIPGSGLLPSYRGNMYRPNIRFHFQVVVLYGQTFIVHVSVKSDVTLYRFDPIRESFERHATLSSYESTITYAIQVVDNMLLVHNMISGLSTVFDVRGLTDTRYDVVLATSSVSNSSFSSVPSRAGSPDASAGFPSSGPFFDATSGLASGPSTIIAPSAASVYSDQQPGSFTAGYCKASLAAVAAIPESLSGCNLDFQRS